MQIEVFADTICPWCYIGKRRLEHALRVAQSVPDSGHSRHPLTVRWRPFLLNPGIAPGGMERKAYLAWKFGAPGRVGFIADRMALEGREDGIVFAFDRIARTPNTVNSHRLIAFAQTQGDATSVVEALFAAYFSDGRDIGARDELVAIGIQCGLDGTALRRYLASNAGLDEVAAGNQQARLLGINAVPCFVFDKREALAGAQPPEVFLRLFDFARHQSASAGVV